MAVPPDGPASLTNTERMLEPSGVHSYRVPLVEGDFLHLVVEQRGVDVTLELFGPGGRHPLLGVDSPNGAHGPEEILWVATEDGDHRLDVRAGEFPANRGAYRLAPWVSRPATGHDLQLVEGNGLLGQGRSLLGQAKGRPVPEAREAQRRFTCAANLFARIGETERLAEATYGQGLAADASSDLAAARDAFRDAAEHFAGVENLDRQGASLNRLGQVLHRLGENRGALEAFDGALNLAKSLGNTVRQIIVLNHRGAVQRTLGDFQGALDGYRQALEGSRTSGDRRREALTLVYLGDLRLALGQSRRAYDAYSLAETLYACLDDERRRAKALKGMGDARYQSGAWDEAKALLEQSLTIRRRWDRRRDLAVALNSLGEVHLALGEVERATEVLQEALGHAREGQEVYYESVILAVLARAALAAGRLEEAHNHYRASRVLAHGLGDPKVEATAWAGMASVEHVRQRWGAASEAIDRALALVELIRESPARDDLRMGYFALRQDYFEMAIDVAMHHHEATGDIQHARRAFELNERRLSRALLDRLGMLGRALDLDAAGAALDEEEALKQRLESLVTQPSSLGPEAEAQRLQVDEILDELARLRSRLAQSSPRYATLHHTEPLEVSEIRERLLDADTVLLVYGVGKHRVFLWWLSHQGLVTRTLEVGQAELEELAEEVMVLHSQGEAQGVLRRERAWELSQLLLDPIADLLGEHRLLIVAESSLQLVPFAALPDPRDPEEGPLLRRHEIVHLPSASVAVALQGIPTGQAAQPQRVAVFADPVFGGDDGRLSDPGGTGEFVMPEPLARAARSVGVERFGRLVHASREAEAILRYVPEPERFTALGFEASLDTLYGSPLGQFRILHFATHGILDRHHPELSGLVLSLVDDRGHPQPGYLRLFDIYNLRLGADLVVLSACQTAVGRAVHGEGVLGLGRAFLHAGARRVITSLWKVDDESTAILMEHFYRFHLEDGLTPAAALRRAQLALSTSPEWAEPYDWAAFVVQGDWR